MRQKRSEQITVRTDEDRSEQIEIRTKNRAEKVRTDRDQRRRGRKDQDR